MKFQKYSTLASTPEWIIYKNQFPASILRTFVDGNIIKFRIQTLDVTIITATYSDIQPFTSDFNFDLNVLNLDDVFSKASQKSTQEVKLTQSKTKHKNMEVESISSTSTNKRLNKLAAPKLKRVITGIDPPNNSNALARVTSKPPFTFLPKPKNHIPESIQFSKNNTNKDSNSNASYSSSLASSQKSRGGQTSSRLMTSQSCKSTSSESIQVQNQLICQLLEQQKKKEELIVKFQQANEKLMYESEKHIS